MDRHLGGQPGGEIGDSDEEEARDTYIQVGVRGNKQCFKNWLHAGAKNIESALI